jgi:hypothetical protein
MFDIPRLYGSACSYSVQTVRIYPILMSILFHHYKELLECVREIEKMEAAASTANFKSKENMKYSTIMEEESEAKEIEEIIPTTLDGFFFS